jgi:hypothetical protein
MHELVHDGLLVQVGDGHQLHQQLLPLIQLCHRAGVALQLLTLILCASTVDTPMQQCDVVQFVPPCAAGADSSSASGSQRKEPACEVECLNKQSELLPHG